MLVLVLLACTGQPDAVEPTLRFDPPAPVRVDTLGPVAAAPRLVVDGADIADVRWSTSAALVAEVNSNGAVVAVGPGRAEVSAAVGGSRASWQLDVEPVITLVVVEPPAQLSVGASAVLDVRGRIGAALVPSGRLEYSAAPSEVLGVSASGEVSARAPGVGWVTVSGSGGAMSTVEIRVVAGE